MFCMISNRKTWVLHTAFISKKKIYLKAFLSPPFYQGCYWGHPCFTDVKTKHGDTVICLESSRTPVSKRNSIHNISFLLNAFFYTHCCPFNAMSCTGSIYSFFWPPLDASQQLHLHFTYLLHISLLVWVLISQAQWADPWFWVEEWYCSWGTC